MLDEAVPLQQQPVDAALLFSVHRQWDHVGSGGVQGERHGWVRTILPHHGQGFLHAVRLEEHPAAMKTALHCNGPETRISMGEMDATLLLMHCNYVPFVLTYLYLSLIHTINRGKRLKIA